MMLDRRPRPSKPSVYRDAVFLSQCTVAEVRDWLSKRPIAYSPTQGTPETPSDAPIFEYLLLRRNDPQIDLCLAEYGRCRSVLERVYKRASPSTRVVACSNASLFVGSKVTGSALFSSEAPLFWQVLHKGSLAELRAVCENPDLSSGMYGGLIRSWVGNEKSRVDADLRTSDDRFMKIVSFLADNPRLRIDRDESRERHFLDGLADYEYGILASECWRLAEIVPPTEAWARCLGRLYSKMKPAYKPYEDLAAVLDRWHPEDELQYAETKNLREALVAHYVKPSMEMLTHEDAAYRRAFYRTFNPDQEAFRDLDWMEWHKRDDYCDFYLLNNENIWKSDRGRSKLKQLLWDTARNSDISAIGWFNEREEAYRSEHPEWFIEQDDDYETEHDADEARRAIRTDISVAYSIHGAGTFAAEAESNEAIGRHTLRDELGDYGEKGLPVYNLDDRKRDRLIAHGRQDAAAAFGHARSAFKSAKEAEKATKRSTILLCVVVGLLAYLVFIG